MKMRVVFTVEDGPAALEQIAACVGFANSMKLSMTMVPEAGPKKERVAWAGSDDARDKDQKAAIEILTARNGVATRKELIDALAAKLRKRSTAVGKMVSKWIKDGVLEEVA